MTSFEEFRFADDGAIPNHPRYPALVHRAALDPAGGPEAAEALFAGCGWVPAWRAGIFPFHHFHSTAHEALAIVGGSATVELGGPHGRALEVRAGDVLVLPAGTGHRRARGEVVVVGAYPPGQDWDLLRGDPAQHDAAVASIGKVPDPPGDPVTGGPIWG